MAPRAQLSSDELAPSPRADAATARTMRRIAPARRHPRPNPPGPAPSTTRPAPLPATIRSTPSRTTPSPLPAPTLRGLSAPQRVLFVAWVAAIGLRAYSDVRQTGDWPCPGPLLKISGLYLMLGVLSEAAPTLAAWLGVGFLVAYVTRTGSREVVTRGTFFGVPVQR